MPAPLALTVVAIVRTSRDLLGLALSNLSANPSYPKPFSTMKVAPLMAAAARGSAS